MSKAYTALTKQIAALSRQLRSRKRDDIAQRPQIAHRMAEAKAQRERIRSGLVPIDSTTAST